MTVGSTLPTYSSAFGRPWEVYFPALLTHDNVCLLFYGGTEYQLRKFSDLHLDTMLINIQQYIRK